MLPTDQEEVELREVLRVAGPASLQVAVRVPSTPARGPSALYRPPCPLPKELGVAPV